LTILFSNLSPTEKATELSVAFSCFTRFSDLKRRIRRRTSHAQRVKRREARIRARRIELYCGTQNIDSMNRSTFSTAFRSRRRQSADGVSRLRKCFRRGCLFLAGKSFSVFRIVLLGGMLRFVEGWRRRPAS